jgi:hypothetical protein
MMIRLITAAIIAAGLFALPAAAQLPRPGKDAPPKAAQKAPAATKQQQPYAAVAVTAPKPSTDADLAAFRKELAAVAARKDRAALAKMVVDKDFFWMKEKDAANKKKSGIDNLSAALDLTAKDGAGWESLADLAADQTAAPLADRKGVVCGPAKPEFSRAEVEKLAQATKTEMSDWGYPASDGIEVRESAAANAPVVEKLGMTLIRVVQDKSPKASQDFVQVVAPSGKSGFVAANAIRPLAVDQLCYVKDGSAWKIAGYIGGD